MSVSHVALGWQAIDPGPPPVSPRMDHPPVPARGADLQAAHDDWRRRCEDDNVQLAAQYATTPLFYPVETPTTGGVIPVYGGGPVAWDSLLTVLTSFASRAQAERVRVVNLTHWRVLDSIHTLGSRSKKTSVRHDTIGQGVSSVDLFRLPDARAIAALVADVLRTTSGSSGWSDAMLLQQDLETVAGFLTDAPVTVARLRDGLAVAAGRALSPPMGIARNEYDSLLDFRQQVVANHTAADLTALAQRVAYLADYQLSPLGKPAVYGSGPSRVRTFSVEASGPHEFEVGREILARAIARSFGDPKIGSEALLVAGAETLGEEVLRTLAGTAARTQRMLVLLFAEMTDLAERIIGYGGSGVAAFMRMPNRSDAEKATSFLGTREEFVVNGYSIAKGETTTVSQSLTRTSSRDSSVSRSFSTGQGFTSSFTRSSGSSMGTSTTHDQGTSDSETVTTSWERDRRNLVEPEEFQQMDELALLVVNGKRVVLADCGPELLAHPLTSRDPWYGG